MNGLGVGTVVGIGCMIGLGVVAPAAPPIAYVTHFLFYGCVSGFIFEMYRMAFAARHPFRR